MSDESTATEKTGHEQLAGALETIVHAVLDGELETIRHSISDLDSKQADRIVALEEHTAKTVESLKQAVLSRVDELRRQFDESQNGRKTILADLEQQGKQLYELKEQFESARAENASRVDAMKDVLEQELGSRDRELQEMKERFEAIDGRVESRIDTAKDALEQRLGGAETELQKMKERFETGQGQIDNRLEEVKNTVEKQLTTTETELLEIRERFETTHGQVDGRIDAVKQALEQEFTVREADLRDQMSTISRNIEGVQLELHQHQDNTKRFSLLLNNLAAVFTEEQRAPSPAMRDALASAARDEAPEPARPSGTDAPELMNGEVDSALDRVFPGES